jgi:hypothetical protein
MRGVDGNLDAHPGTQRRETMSGRVDAYAHRDPLHDLDPITTSVLCRQQ